MGSLFGRIVPVASRIASAGAVAIMAVGSCAAGSAPLIDAVREQNPNTVSALIASHADVNAGATGGTALAWAAYEDRIDIVDLLLKAGAKVNVADEYGETPLTLACANGNAQMAETLLKAGADATAARWNGETALMIAARTGNAPLVAMLIGHGAKVDAAESRKGQNALMWAASQGHFEVVGLLLKAGANPNTSSVAGFTPLIFAAQKGDPKSTASLIKAGAKPDYLAPAGVNALLVAMTLRNSAVADVLIANGASVTAKDRGGNTALHMAAQDGDLPLAKELIAKGADVNAQTGKSQAGGRGGGGGNRAVPAGEQTPLMFAARGNHIDIMHALIAAGADPLLKAQDGSTLIMAAAASGRLEAVQYAFDLGSGVKAMNDKKQTAMHAAVTAPLAISSNGAANAQGTTEAEICKVLQFLAAKGADLDPVDANGITPLGIADVPPSDNTRLKLTMVVDLLTKLIRATGAEPHRGTQHSLE